MMPEQEMESRAMSYAEDGPEEPETAMEWIRRGAPVKPSPLPLQLRAMKLGTDMLMNAMFGKKP